MPELEKQITYDKILWILNTRKTYDPKKVKSEEIYARMIANHIHANFVLKEDARQQVIEAEKRGMKKGLKLEQSRHSVQVGDLTQELDEINNAIDVLLKSKGKNL